MFPRSLLDKWSWSPFTVTGQDKKGSCYSFSLEFETPLALQTEHVEEE